MPQERIPEQVTNLLIQICNDMSISLRRRQECYEELAYPYTAAVGGGPANPNQTYTIGGSLTNPNQTYTIGGRLTNPNQTYTVGGGPTTNLNQTYAIDGGLTNPNQIYTISQNLQNQTHTIPPIPPNRGNVQSISLTCPLQDGSTNYDADVSRDTTTTGIRPPPSTSTSWTATAGNATSRIANPTLPNATLRTSESETVYETKRVFNMSSLPIATESSGGEPTFRTQNASQNLRNEPLCSSELTGTVSTAAPTFTGGDSETLYVTQRMYNVSSSLPPIASSGRESSSHIQSISQDSRNGPSGISSSGLTGPVSIAAPTSTRNESETLYITKKIVNASSLLPPTESSGEESSSNIPNVSQSSGYGPLSSSRTTGTSQSNGTGSEAFKNTGNVINLSTIQQHSGSSGNDTISKLQNTSGDSGLQLSAAQLPRPPGLQLQIPAESTPKRLVIPPCGNTSLSYSGSPITNPTTQDSRSPSSSSVQFRSVPVPVSSPGSSRTPITPYCESLAYLKCPNCQKCLQITVDSIETEGSLSDLNVTGFLNRMRGTDNGVSAAGNNNTQTGNGTTPGTVNTTNTSGTQRDIGPVLDRSPRQIIPELNQTPQRFILPLQVDNRGDTICGATSAEISANDSFRSGRVQAAATDLLRNPIADSSLSSGISSLRIAPSTSFEISQNGLGLEGRTTVPVNTIDILEEHWRNCDDAFKRDMTGLIPGLENLIRLIQSFK